MMFDYARDLVLETYLNGLGIAFAGAFRINALVQDADPADNLAAVVGKAPSGGGYAPVDLASFGDWSSPGLGAGQFGNGVVTNNVPIIFPVPTGAAGIVRQVAVTSKETVSALYKPLFYGDLEDPFVWDVPSGPLILAPGKLRIRFRGKCWGDALRNDALTGFFTGISSIPASYYLGLLTRVPEPDGTGLDEVQAVGTNGYARIAFAVDGTQFRTGLAGYSTNEDLKTWPTPTGSWGSRYAPAWGLFDAASSGNLWWFGKCRRPIPPVDVSTPAPPVLPADLSIGLDIGTWA